MISHVQHLGIAFKERQVNDRRVYQLFVFDIAAAEAKGPKAPEITSALLSDASAC